MVVSFLTQNSMAPVEIKEADSHYQITMEIPGSARDDIKIWSESGLLIITGEKKVPTSSRLWSERIAGRFSRSFQIPDEAAIDKIEAGYKDGVLTIEIPKIEQFKQKTIEIK
jgi:HSP20 family protein